MRVFTMLNSIFGVPKTSSIIFRGQQRNSGMDPPVLKVREYPPLGTLVDIRIQCEFCFTDETMSLGGARRILESSQQC